MIPQERFKKIFQNRWVRETLLFVAFYLITLLNDNTNIIEKHEVRSGFFMFLVVYLHVQTQRFLILPLLVKKHKTVLYWICAIVTLLVFTQACYLTDKAMLNVGWYDELPDSHLSLVVIYFFSCVLSLIILLLVYFLFQYYQFQQKQSEYLLLQKEMELHRLRSQVNPHFLFNSLNNIYGVSLQKPLEVSDRIMQLAQVIRHQLQLSQKDSVLLSEDLNFIEDYVKVESGRVSDYCQVVFEVHQHDQPAVSYTIRPMILISYIENAFKHGPDRSHPGYIHIAINIENAVLQLVVENSCTANKHTKGTGIGLQNTHQRLELLYSGKYELNISQNDTAFTVRLSVKLN